MGGINKTLDVVRKGPATLHLRHCGSLGSGGVAVTRPEIETLELLKLFSPPEIETAPKDLPGKPDLVVRAWKLAIFVNGCFWHQHNAPSCTLIKPTKAYAKAWDQKFKRNRERLKRQLLELHNKGYRSVVVWECETRCPDCRPKILKRIKDAIPGGLSGKGPPIPQTPTPPHSLPDPIISTHEPFPIPGRMAKA